MRSRALSNRLIDLVDSFGREAEISASALEFLDFLAGNRAAFLRELQKILDLEADVPELSFSDILAARYEGIPLEIFFRRRQKRKAKIVALCDVSYSVWKAVPFMLNILYSVQDCLSRVRSFVFIARVTDVSETMKDHAIMDAIDRIMARFKLESPTYVVYGNGESRGKTAAA